MSTTETPPPPHTDPGPRVSAEEARDLTRLRRTTSVSPQGRHIAGVAGGLARHLDVDPLVVRVAMVVLVFFGGAGIILYAAGWLLVPEDGAEHAVIRIDDRTRNLLLWVVAALAALAVVGESFGRFRPPWPLIVIGLLLLWLFTRRRRYDRWIGETPTPGDAATPTGTPAPGSAGTHDSAGRYGTSGTYDAAPGPDTASVPATAATSALAVRTAPVDLTKPGATQSFGPIPPTPPTPPTMPLPPYPRSDPRKTGPVLFWITLAFVALGLGVLGLVDVAGAHIASAAYPATALGIIGAMLVLGAFIGRAGGLIALGLAVTLALVLNGIGDHIGPRQTIDVAPTTAAAVASTYHVGGGRLTLDLSQVRDLPALDGRRIDLSANAGKIEVIVPAALGVDLQARVHGPGDIRAFGADHGGIGVTVDQVYAGDPTITVVADMKVGQIELREPNGGTR